MLYNLYRPATFADVIGQPAARVLMNAVETERYAHSILLSGTRGVGKTTLARIYAKAVNCQGKGQKPCGKCSSCKIYPHPDIHEVDSAIFGGVSQVESITHRMRLSPQFTKSVFIFDEAQTLSKKAMSVLLKSVEEPRSSSLVLFLTTEPDKIDRALRSRCMWLQLRPIQKKSLMGLLAKVCKAEGLAVSKEAIVKMADYANGSARDALSLLETTLGYGKVDSELIESIVGHRVDVEVLVDNFLSGDCSRAFAEITRLCHTHDPKIVIDACIHEMVKRMNMAVEVGGSAKIYIDWAATLRECKRDSTGHIPELALEMAVAKMSSMIPEDDKIKRLMDWPAFCRYVETKEPKFSTYLTSTMKPIRIKAGKVLVCKSTKVVVDRRIKVHLSKWASQYCSLNVEVQII